MKKIAQLTNTTVAFMATIEDDMDYLRDAGEDAVLDAVFSDDDFDEGFGDY